MAPPESFPLPDVVHGCPQDSTVNTYLSRDAGRTWEEIAKGAHIYEFGDSGGVIVMTKHGLHTATDTLLYSLDEGLNWEEERFTTGEAVDIYNIRVEPDNQGKKFVIQVGSRWSPCRSLPPKLGRVPPWAAQGVAS